VIDKSATLFNIRVVSYTVRDGPTAVDDGIFEPGQEIVLSNVKLTNTGGLNLPEGSYLRCPFLFWKLFN
jgi:hypothetical protein